MSIDRINERIARADRARRLLWWWRFPYLALLALTVYLLYVRFPGFVGLFLAVSVGAMGVAVVRISPWRGR